jgi:hypothetical protein
MLHTEQMHPAPARRIQAAGSRRQPLEGNKKTRSFFERDFFRFFFRLRDAKHSRARTREKVAKVFESRYSRVKKSPVDARKSRSRVR